MTRRKRPPTEPPKQPEQPPALEQARAAVVIAVFLRKDLPGRPTKWLTPEGLDLVEKWAANGATIKGIAAKLGMNRDTFVEARKRQPEIDERLAVGTGVHETELVDLLTAKARKGDTVAALFLLKGRHGWREGEARDGGGSQVNVQIVLPGAMSPEQYRASLPVAAPLEPGGDDPEQPE